MRRRGLCDPHVRVYEGQVYLYGTHDANPAGTNYEMSDWWVWTSKDLVSWSQAGLLRPEETYWKRPCDQCWATDAISRNGKYYLYFSRGPEEIGVVVSDSPAGPWHDTLRKPLIAERSTPTLARDPGILQEEDGTSYLIFGCWDYYIARLNPDMTSLAETPRLVEVDHKMGPYGPGKLDDKPYLHKRGEFYYLSWGCYYAMSKDVYGPYQYRDCFIKPDSTAPEFRPRLTFDRHGSFFDYRGQSYFICNDLDSPGCTTYFRDSIISYVHYRDNGEIATLHLDPMGVGRYDLSKAVHQAATFSAATNARVCEDGNGAFQVAGLSSKSTITYSNCFNLPPNPSLFLEASCAAPGGARIEVRDQEQGGRLLGSCQISSTGSWSKYSMQRCLLNTKANRATLALSISGGAGELVRLKTFGLTART